MATRIRRGRAEDVEFLAWVMHSASRAHLQRGLWDLIIGEDVAGCREYLRRLALAEPRSLYHYESFLIAEVDGVPAAALSGFLPRDAWAVVGEAMSHVQRGLNWTEEQAAGVYQRVGPIWENCTPPDIGADFVIESVATLPEYRRRGLVQNLIQEALQSGIEHGCCLAQISTYIGNNAAIAAYEKSGFQIRDEKRCRNAETLLGVPGFIRLMRELKID